MGSEQREQVFQVVRAGITHRCRCRSLPPQAAPLAASAGGSVRLGRAVGVGMTEIGSTAASKTPTPLVRKHRYFGHMEYEISVYETGHHWNKWNARYREVGVGTRIDVPGVHFPPPAVFYSEYRYGDPFGARTPEGALKKALRSIRKADERRARDDALVMALQASFPDLERAS